MLDLTGPQALALAAYAWLNGNLTGQSITTESGFVVGCVHEHGDLFTWSREAVFPYIYTEMHWTEFRQENYPEAYAAHHWGGEWQKEDAACKAVIAG